MKKLIQLVCLSLCLSSVFLGYAESNIEYYRDVSWKPRVMITPDEALNNFWPQSPAPTPVHYTPMGLDKQRLGKIPKPSVHPRVYLTPDTAEEIRKKIALGDKESPAFKNIWSRFKAAKKNSPLYAYLIQDDALGKRLAATFVQDFSAIERTITAFEKYSDSKDFNSVQKTMVFHGDPALSTGILRLLSYDYLYQWLSDSEREQARKLIAKVTHDRITNFMTIPDHWMINNHQGFAKVYLSLLLQIEGETGYNQKVFELGVSKVRAMLDYYLTDTGMCYETIKGWLPMGDWMPVFRRYPKLLDHSHLHAKMDFYLKWIRYKGNGWDLRDEMRNSTFHVIWMMHYLYPTIKNYDFLYSSTFSSFKILKDPKSRWTNPVGTNWENLLLSAQNTSKTDYSKPNVVTQLENDTFWTDPTRGYMSARNSWKPGDLYVDIAGKQDLVYGGHEGAEQGRWAMWKDGINWTYNTDLLFNKEATVQNMISIDGKSLKWPPVSSVWLGAGRSKDAAWAAVDYKDGYSFVKQQRHPLNSPAHLDTNWRGWGRNMLKFNRDQQMQYHDSGIQYHDGYAHTDYGAWNNEQRLLEDYRPYNTMEKAYRTLIMARGKYPYIITLDDVKKDNETRSYLWNMALPFGMTQVSTLNTDFTRNQEPHDYVDILVASDETKKNLNRKADWVPPYHRPSSKDPVCLVRIFNRITSSQYPTPGIRRSNNHTILEVPGLAKEADYKVLIYPHRHGQPTPKSSWNKDKTAYTIEFPNQKDIWHFEKTDGGRTIFALERNGKIVQHPNASPSRPILRVNSIEFNPAKKRYRRDENNIPKHKFIDQIQIMSVLPEYPAVFRYTLDGSEPTDSSPIFNGILNVGKSTVFKIKHFNSEWIFGIKESKTTTVQLIKQKPSKSIQLNKTQTGLHCRVYEIPTRIYDNNGFFDTEKSMLPNLDLYTPLAEGTVPGFTLPDVTPQLPMLEEAKGFYRLKGFIKVHKKDTYRIGLYSTGPVHVMIGKKTAILHKGIFHQNQDWRYGEVNLEAGWHDIEVIVTDPVFYKINNHDTMPIKIKVIGTHSGLVNLQLAHNQLDSKELDIGQNPISLSPLNYKFSLEAGLVQKVYNRPGKMLYDYIPSKDLLDIDSFTPTLERLTNTLENNSSNESISVYEGYFKAPLDGTYHFNTEKQSKNYDLHCNQVRLNGQVIIQRGAPGRLLTGKVLLKAGLYKLSFRLGSSSALLKVTYPNKVVSHLKANQLYRVSTPRLYMQGLSKSQSTYEIFGPTVFKMTPPRIHQKVEVRYTIDGTHPNSDSPLFPGGLKIEQNLDVKLAAFTQKKQVSEVSQYTIQAVESPTLGQMIYLNMATIGNAKRIPSKTLSNAKAFAGSHAKIEPEGIVFSKNSNETKGEANVNKESGRIGIVVKDLNFNDNAMSIVLKAKFKDINGKLMGKFGFNAWGKGYTTIQAYMNNGGIRLKAQPADLRSRIKLKKNTWYSIIFTGSSEQTKLYLDGNLISENIGAATLPSSSLDFFINMEATVSELRIFNRPLHLHEIKQLVHTQK